MSSNLVSETIVSEIADLGGELNANQYRIVHLAADYDASLEWFHHGYKSAASVIARTLGIHTSTASEWIRVGRSLKQMPIIDLEFANNDLSYAKVRILTRWVDHDNEQQLLDLARERSANRLTTAILRLLGGTETDADRDQRHHTQRSVSTWTDADGMVVIRAVLPPAIGKQIAAAIDTITKQVAATPTENPTETAGSFTPTRPSPCVTDPVTQSRPESSADDPNTPTTADLYRQLKQPWQPPTGDGMSIPTLAQQRADALAMLFLTKNLDLVTEVVIHVRGDGTTFDDGTPITNNTLCQRLDQSFIRLLIHDTQRRPINASRRQRHPTTRQKRVVLETHNHECIDCQSTHLLELDHNPPYQQIKHTITTELQPRCAPCHRARHRKHHNQAA